MFDQYEIWYKDLGGKNWDTLCAPRKTKGIILRWEIDDDDDGDDWNMYIGKDPDNEGHAYAGIWDEVNKEKYLIDINDPFFDFGGIFLEINMSDDLFERLEGDETENTEPKKDKGKTSF